jgi:signal transduction histidine kinase
MEYLRKDFISNVSHELKTPISSIKGFAEMLRDKDLSEEDFQAYTKIIIEESKRLSHLSSNMLRLSRLDHQLIPESSNTFFLDEQIRRTLVLLEEKWSGKKLKLDLDLEKIVYTGDEDLIQQIWLNLIENAIKFSAESGTIYIQARKIQNKAVVEVKDQGIGITESDQERIYEKFFQADKSHSKEGSGLGLAIIKRIVEIHQGEINFTSEAGCGTSFTVKLPLNS